MNKLLVTHQALQPESTEDTSSEECSTSYHSGHVQRWSLQELTGPEWWKHVPVFLCQGPSADAWPILALAEQYSAGLLEQPGMWYPSPFNLRAAAPAVAGLAQPCCLLSP